MFARILAPTLALLTFAACSGSDPGASLGNAQEEIAIIPRGATCAQLGLGNQSFTIQAPQTGDYSIDGTNSLSFHYYDDTDTIFYFNNATLGITGVLVSAGDRTLEWELGVPGADAWPSLHGPPDAVTGDIPTPEEVTFCYDYELHVQPSPFANYAHRNTWTITNTGRGDHLTLAQGQEELVEYSVTVRHTTSIADGQFIAGPMYVENRSPNTVTVGAVTVMVGELAATVTCPTAPPFTMAPFTLVECAFHADVPDTEDRNVVGSATVSHGLRVSTQEVVASFSSPTTGIEEVDRCVDVFDDAVPYSDHYLGTVCADQGEQTFDFSAEIGPFTTCGPFSVANTASYTGLDTGAHADAGWTVSGDVQCHASCTLPQHYWKVHSHFGPRRYNPTWTLIGAQGENTPFFTSGGTYIQAMYHLSQGNPYWTLAKAYIAARLNQLNDATFTPATTTAFNSATALFNQYAPAQVAGNQAVKKNFTKAAATLKDFNSGRTGPGRCTSKPDLDDED
jgi:hypothetical protein